MKFVKPLLDDQAEIEAIKSIKAFEKWIHKQVEIQIKADVKEYFYWREFIQLNQE